MTDKQIIDLTEIDKKYKDKCSLIKAGKCKNVNIFIEQSRKLKAKEQECEELAYENYELNELFDRLKTENDRLINELDRLNEDRIEALKQLEFIRTLNTVQEAEIRKYSKTLTEIKEITERVKGYDPLAKQILQKINEVEDES